MSCGILDRFVVLLWSVEVCKSDFGDKLFVVSANRRAVVAVDLVSDFRDWVIVDVEWFPLAVFLLFPFSSESSSAVSASVVAASSVGVDRLMLVFLVKAGTLAARVVGIGLASYGERFQCICNATL